MAYNNNINKSSQVVTNFTEPKLEQQEHYLISGANYNFHHSEHQQQQTTTANTMQFDNDNNRQAIFSNGFFGCAGNAAITALPSHVRCYSNDAVMRSTSSFYNSAQPQLFRHSSQNNAAEADEQMQFAASTAASQTTHVNSINVPFINNYNTADPNTSSWFAWLQSAGPQSTSVASCQQSLPILIDPTNPDSTMLVSRLANVSNGDGNRAAMAVDINAAYEANRIQIQDVYKAVEFEMHRRLSMPKNYSTTSTTTPAGGDNLVGKPGAVFLSAPCLNGNSNFTTSNNDVNSTPPVPVELVSEMASEIAAHNIRDLLTPPTQLPPSPKFITSQSMPTSNNSPANFPVSSNLFSKTTALSGTTTSPLLFNAMQRKTIQKPAHQHALVSTLTAPQTGVAPKKRTAVFSQFTGLLAAPTMANDFVKIEASLSFNSSEDDRNTNATDDDDTDDDAASNIYDSKGRPVAAVLAPLTSSSSNSSQVPAAVDARDSVLVCYTFWRLALVKKVRRDVTLGEIRRRLAPPESFTLSQLGSLLRLAKVRGSGPALKHRLEHYGLRIESSQRTLAKQTLFMALLESEANTLAHEFKTLCTRHFPRRQMAEFLTHKSRLPKPIAPVVIEKDSNLFTTSFDNADNAYRKLEKDDRNSTSQHTHTESCCDAAMPENVDDLIGCADTLAELRSVLQLDRSPLMSYEPVSQLPHSMQYELNNFSASTHGFGTQTIVHHIALLEDVLKSMARSCAPTAAVVAGESNDSNSSALLMRQH